MRFFAVVFALAAAALLSACPRRTSESDGGGSDDAGYDPGTGYAFTGDIVLDDARVMDIDPATLRAGASACRAPILARVTRIVDGDTMHVMGLSEVLPDADIRFIGVNAPEIAHMPGDVPDCFGDNATVFTSQLNAHLVWLTFDVDCLDPYGRLLAYVHIGSGEGDMWQRQMVRRGFAHAIDYRPNSMYAALLAADQVTAEAEGVGLWTACP